MQKQTNIFQGRQSFLIRLTTIVSALVIGMFWYYAVITSASANNSPSSVYDGISPPGPVMNPSPVPCTNGEEALLIQDNVPWFAPLNQDPLGANVTELKAQNKKFCIINSGEIGIANLNQFPEIIISAAQIQSFYDNLFPGNVVHPALVGYVQNGGILSANLTDNASGPGAGGNWDDRTFIGGLTHTNDFTQNNNIVFSSHPIITGQFGGVNGGQVVDITSFQDLDDWNFASHGFFTNLPSNTRTILRDVFNRPVLIEYSFGNGIVIASQITNEWRYAGDFGSLLQNKKLLSNEIGYQGSLVSRCTPIDPNALANTKLMLAGNRFVALKDSPLAGLENEFIQQGCKHHVDPRLLVAIAAHESSLGLGFELLHVNPPSQATTTDNGLFNDGLGRQWQWKAGTKFCGKFNPFGLLHGITSTIRDCVDVNKILFDGRAPLKFDNYSKAINYLAGLLVADWLYFDGNERCDGSKTTVAGIADNQGAGCGYTGPGEETSWIAGVSGFLSTLIGSPNDVRNPAGFIQPRPERTLTSADFLLISDPIDILITDPQGRRIGFDIVSQQIINDIPDATFSGRGTNPTRISISAPLDGEYGVFLSAETDTPYLLQLFTQNASGTFPRVKTAGDIAAGEKINIQLQYDFERGSSLPLLLEIKPETLNPISKGIFTAFLIIPTGLDIQVKEISASTIRLEGIVPINVKAAGNKKLIAKFDREDFSDIFIGKKETILNLTGTLKNGVSISAIDTVKLLNKRATPLSLLLASLSSVLSELLSLLESL